MDAEHDPKLLHKIRSLIQKAESTEFPEERDSLLAGADKLMLKYAIDEAALESTRPAAQRQVPERIMIKILPKGHHLIDALTRLAMEFAAHYRCKIIFHGLYKNDFYSHISASVVGFPSDLKFFEMMFTTAQLHIIGQIEPKPDLAKSFDENVYILHDAGMSWRKIVYAMGKTKANGQEGESAVLVLTWPDLPTYSEHEVRGSGGKCKTAYRRWCKHLGIPTQRIQSPVNYQRQFAAGYNQRVANRLWEMRQASRGEAGSALELRQEDVTSKFEELFPDVKTIGSKARERYDADARARGHKAGSELDLGGNKMGNSRKSLD